MAQRCRRLITSSHVRPLLPAVLLLVPAVAVALILIEGLTGVDRPAAIAHAGRGEDGAGATAASSDRARTITIGWVGDITPGSQYGLPADGGRGLFANVRRTL